ELSRRAPDATESPPPGGRRPRACGALGAGLFPGLEVGQRVDRMTARSLPAADPHLQVQVRCRRVAGLPGAADELAGGHRLPFRDVERAGLAVREHEIEADQRVLDDVVA